MMWYPLVKLAFALFFKIKGRYGLCDLAQFNVTLLAKQCQRIINNTDCFLAKVLKARYFSRTNFLSAKLGTYSSFTWRSILAAKELIEASSGQRIGIGQNMNIQNDVWITGHGSGRAQYDQINISYLKVSQLVDEHTRTWKEERVKAIFDKNQAGKILLIPLSITNEPNLLIWRFDRSSEYTPKSGYKFLLELDSPTGNYQPMGHIDHLTKTFTILCIYNSKKKLRLNFGE